MFVTVWKNIDPEEACRDFLPVTGGEKKQKKGKKETYLFHGKEVCNKDNNNTDYTDSRGYLLYAEWVI